MTSGLGDELLAAAYNKVIYAFAVVYLWLAIKEDSCCHSEEAPSCTHSPCLKLPTLIVGFLVGEVNDSFWDRWGGRDDIHATGTQLAFVKCFTLRRSKQLFWLLCQNSCWGTLFVAYGRAWYVKQVGLVYSSSSAFFFLLCRLHLMGIKVLCKQNQPGQLVLPCPAVLRRVVCECTLRMLIVC